MAASAGAIRAGQAYVEITARDGAFMASMNRMRQQMSTIGKGMMMAGGAGLAIGTGVIGSIVGAAVAFAEVGSALYDMSSRTGVATEALSVLQFAAQQTGTDMASVETGIRKMQKAIEAAAGGSDEAAKALGAVGLTAQQLQCMSADQQMGMIADGLMAIEDPGARAAAAMAIFGKSGTMLLPMLEGGSAGMSKFAAQARSLGLVMDAETAAKADALGDSLDALKAAGMMAFVQIGAAAAPIITQVAESLTSLAATVGQFIAENAGMVVGVLKAAAALTAVSGVVVAVGAVISSLGTIIAGVQASFGVLSSLSVLLSPIGLIAGGVAAAIGLIAIAARQLSPEFKEATDALLGFGSAGAEAGGDKNGEAAVQAARQKKQAAEEQAAAARDAAEEAARQREEEQKAAREREALMQRGKQLQDSVATPEEKLQAQVSDYQNLLDQGAIDTQTFARLIAQAKENAVRDMSQAGSDAKAEQMSISSAGTFGQAAALGIGPELNRLEDPMRGIEANTRATVDALTARAMGEPIAPEPPSPAFDAAAGGIAEGVTIPSGFDAAMAAGRRTGQGATAADAMAGLPSDQSAFGLTDTERAVKAAMNIPPLPSVAADAVAPRASSIQQAASTGTQAAASVAQTASESMNAMSAKLIAAIGKTTAELVKANKTLLSIAMADPETALQFE